MKILKGMLRELLGLFLEDEFLAVGILFVVGATIVLTKAFSIIPLAAGAWLFVGCIAVLGVGVWRTARDRRTSRNVSHPV